MDLKKQAQPYGACKRCTGDKKTGTGSRKQRKMSAPGNGQNRIQNKVHGERTGMCSRMTKGSSLPREDRTVKSHHTEQNAQGKN